MQNPVLAQIVDERSTYLPVVGVVYDRNSLLRNDDIIGIKTRNSNQAGGSYVFAARDPLTITRRVLIVGAIVVVPYLQDAFGATVPLLNSVEQMLALEQILQPAYRGI